MLSASETTCRLIAVTFLLAANKVLQSCARNLRATWRSIVLRMMEKNAIGLCLKTRPKLLVYKLKADNYFGLRFTPRTGSAESGSSGQWCLG